MNPSVVEGNMKVFPTRVGVNRLDTIQGVVYNVEAFISSSPFLGRAPAWSTGVLLCSPVILPVVREPSAHRWCGIVEDATIVPS